MSTHTHQSQNLTYRLILPGMALVLCAGLTALFWPGVGTWETLQFEMQRQLPVMNDWKSPFVTYLYWAADYIFNSTGPVLFFQQVLFWLGLALVAHHTFSSTMSKAIFFLMVAFLPLVWTTEILLWKEAWTLSFLTLSIGSIFACLNTGKSYYAVIAVISAVLLSATRQNAVLLALPGLYIGAKLLAARTSGSVPGKQRLILISTVTILVAVTLSAIWLFNKKGIQRCHIWHHGLVWDLAAISLSEGEILVPDEFRKSGSAGSLKRIQAYFTYYNSDPLFYGPKSPLKLHGSAASPCDQKIPLDIVLESWWGAVRTYPVTYLRHRLLYIIHLLGIFDASQNHWGKKYYRNDSEYSSTMNQASLFEKLKKNAVFKSLVSGTILPGWFYVVLFLGSGMGLSHKKNTAATCLQMIWLAGLLYLGSFVVIGSAAVMRFLTVFAVLGPAIIAGRWSVFKSIS